jgi:hypothetical protein
MSVENAALPITFEHQLLSSLLPRRLDLCDIPKLRGRYCHLVRPRIVFVL